jgi:acyl carrier protein
MTESPHLDLVRAALAEELGLVPAAIAGEMALGEIPLNCDMLDMAGAAVTLEAKLGIEIGDHELDACVTVADLAALCTRLAHAAAEGG